MTRKIAAYLALYWLAIYGLLSVRALVSPQPHFELQAAFRLVIVAMGSLLSLALTLLFLWSKSRRLRDRIILLVAGALFADLFYSIASYTLLYEISGAWTPKLGLAATIGSYLVEFFWLFPLWVLILLYLDRKASASRPLNPAQMTSLWATDRGTRVRVPIANVLWFQSEGDYVRVCTGEKSYLIRSTLGSVERTVSKQDFVRIHRRIIVSAHLIRMIKWHADGRQSVVLDDGNELPVGRTYSPHIRDLVNSGSIGR